MPHPTGPSEEAVRTVLENFERQQRQQTPPADNGQLGGALETMVDGAELVFDAGDILEGVGEVLGAVAEGAGGLIGSIFEGLGSF
jgi:hypothetical protein